MHSHLTARIWLMVCLAVLLSLGSLRPATAYTQTLVDPYASQATQDLFDYFCSIYGTQCLSGQPGMIHSFVTPGDNYVRSGRYPAIAGEDFSSWGASCEKTPADMTAYVNWHIKYRTILSFQWHWMFDGQSAWTNQRTTPVDVSHLTTPGTPEYYDCRADLSRVADCLQEFEDANIPILFRPLHEIDGGWFWWTDLNNPANTRNLYRMIYDYMTTERGLHNLIWVYNAGDWQAPYGSSTFYPGSQYVDIISMDPYNGDVKDNHDYYLSIWSYLDSLDSTKMKALAECGALPNPDLMAAGTTPKWLYATPWWPIGSEQNVDNDYGIRALRHPFIVTEDELPVFPTQGGGENLYPSVSIDSPLDNGVLRYTGGPDPVITVNASDRDGTITEVKLYRDGVLIGTDTTAPYTFTIPTSTPAGIHHLRATAYDNSSHSEQSQTVRMSYNVADLALHRPVVTSEGSDGSAMVDGDYWTAWSMPTASYFVNGDFESPWLAAITPYEQATPSVVAGSNHWTFTGSSGIQHNNSAWTTVNAPGGQQTAYLAGGSTPGKIAQTHHLVAGTYYKLTFKAARVSGGAQPLQFSVDGNPIGTLITPPDNAFTEYTTVAFTVSTTGEHTIAVEATTSEASASLLDGVYVVVADLNLAWAYVDLGATHTINEVDISYLWKCFGAEFDIAVSTDASTWTTVASLEYDYLNKINSSTLGTLTVIDEYPVRSFNRVTFTPTSARYVKFVGRKCQENWGSYIIAQFEVPVPLQTPNHAPVITVSASANPAVFAGNTGVQVTASDPDGDYLTYTWSVIDGDTQTAEFSKNGTVFTHHTTFSTDSAGVYTLRVTVSDNRGGNVTSDVTVTAKVNLAAWDFVNATSNAQSFSAISLAGNPPCTTSTLTRGDGLIPAGNHTGCVSVYPADPYGYFAQTLTEAISKEEYLTFTVTPTTGTTLGLSQLTFYPSFGQTGTGVGAGITYSTDGVNFSNGLTAVGTPAISASPFTVDLSTVTALQGVTSAVTFRIYGYGVGQYSNIYIGNNPYYGTPPGWDIILEGMYTSGTAEAPTFSPAAGTYTTAQTVTLSTTTSGASMRYTTDNSTPTATNGTLYNPNNPVTIGSSCTLKAIAYKSGMNNSSVTSGNYTVNLDTTELAVWDFVNDYSNAQSFSAISLGGTPPWTTSTLTRGDGLIPVDNHQGCVSVYTADPYGFGAQTLTEAITKEEYLTFTVTPTTGTTLELSQLTFYPSFGQTGTGVGAGITYSTDGVNFSNGLTAVGTPAISASPFTVNLSTVTALQGVTSAVTFRIYGYGVGQYIKIYIGNNPYYGTPEGWDIILEGMYTSGTVEAPTFSSAAGTYTTAQRVTLSTTTSGANMRYTTDNSTPTATNGTLYTGPVTLHSSCTLKAIAYKSGMNNSSVTSGDYTISSGTTELVVWDFVNDYSNAEDFSAISLGGTPPWTTSTLTRGDGLIPADNHQGCVSVYTADPYGFGAQTLTEAITKEEYLTFTVTPTTGTTLELSQLTFYPSFGQTGTGVGAGITYSTDGVNFSNGLTAVGTPAISASPFTVDLSTVTALQGVTSAVTFRIYGYGVGQYIKIYIGDNPYYGTPEGWDIILEGESN